MSENVLKTRFRHATKNESEWKSSNPVLLNGEIAYSSDKNNRYKVGNGTSKWSELSYAKANLEKTDVTTALGYTPPTTNTTYSDATQSTHGLMTASDKKKLDGIASGATAVTDSTVSGWGYKKTDTNTWRPLGTTADTACAGNDSRLSNARPASDVSSWAKASTKPTYTKSEVGLGNVDNTADSAKTVAKANQLTTARTVSGGIDIPISFSYNGSANSSASIGYYNSSARNGNTNNYPYHRFAKLDTIAASYSDKTMTVFLTQDYNGGGFGIARISLRTNNGTTVSSAEVKWLVRQGFSADAIQIGIYNVFGATYADAFLKLTGSYCGTVIRAIANGNRGSISRTWTLINSQEVDNTTTNDAKTSVESYVNIATAATKLHNRAYSTIVVGSDTGTVSYANSAGSASMATALSSSAGSATQPVYFSSGKPSACTYSLAKSVPADAKFTDTTYSDATTSAHGLMTADMVTKLNGVATGANNYSHPTNSGNKHIPSGGSSGQILRWSADGTATWGADNNTDTKVTSVSNHYTPSGGSTTSASGGALTDITNSSAGVQVLTGVTKDAAGHITGVTSVALKSVNTNTTYSNFVKSGSGAKSGLVPAPSTTAGTTKYLREDGTWQVPPDNNTTYSNMTAASASAAGKAGLVPAPAAGTQAKFLRGDGTWQTPTNTTYNDATTKTHGLMSTTDKTRSDTMYTALSDEITESMVNSLF